MASYQIMSWKHIPSQVKAWDGDGEVKRMLPDYFQAAIDAYAMKDGSTEMDAYLDGWSGGRSRSGTALPMRWWSSSSTSSPPPTHARVYSTLRSHERGRHLRAAHEQPAADDGDAAGLRRRLIRAGRRVEPARHRGSPRRHGTRMLRAEDPRHSFGRKSQLRRLHERRHRLQRDPAGERSRRVERVSRAPDRLRQDPGRRPSRTDGPPREVRGRVGRSLSRDRTRARPESSTRPRTAGRSADALTARSRRCASALRGSAAPGPMLTSTSMAATFTAAAASVAAATASARRFWLPLLSRSRASLTTATPDRAISSGVSMVLSRAPMASRPDRVASRNSRNPIESSSMSSSARRRKASAFSWAERAPFHLSDRTATFCSRAADTASTAAAADPLAGAGSPDASLPSR